ncbi:MAG: SDR family oxidoreductase [Gammaproteobacteria bacterium]
MAKVAFVTGASQGIGRAIAARLAGLDFDLLLLGRNESALQETANICQSKGTRAEIFPGNLGDESYMSAAVSTALEWFGTIDLLVNNAGIAQRAAVQEADLTKWREVMDLNFHAIVYLCREILPIMIEKESGKIINISSISGRNTNAGGAIYCASKHALNGFSGSMYEDVRDYGVKVCSIMPGFVDTSLTQGLGLEAGNMIRPDDVADAVAYVVSASANCCPTEIVLRPQKRP